MRVWFGSSHGFRALDIAVDLLPGGVPSLQNVKDAVTEHVSGAYHTVEPERRLTGSFSSGCGQPGWESGGWSSTLFILDHLQQELHGIGSVHPALPTVKVSGLAADLAEVPRRHDAKVSAARAP